MRISVRVKPGSREDKILRDPDGVFTVFVRARAQGGDANNAARRLVAEYFGVPQNAVAIARGHTARMKIVEIRSI